MKEFDGEIAYESNEGPVHSDIGWRHSVYSDELNDEFRQFYHQCLDEWLNKSNGTGAFWIGDREYFKA